MEVCTGVSWLTHPEIVFGVKECPLCEALKEQEALEKEVVKLEVDIENHECPYSYDVACESE